MFNVLDLVILAVLLLSGLIAAWRGFTREVLSIGAWVGAAVVMFVFGPKAVPFAAQYVHKEIIATVIGYGAVFVIALLPLSYVSYRIAEGVRDSAIGPVDRILGFVFGLARGLVIIGVGFLVFTSLVGENRQPDWFKEAKLRPLMESTGKVIATLLPAHKTGDPDAAPPDEDPTIGGTKAEDQPAKDQPAAKDQPPPGKAQPAAKPAALPKPAGTEPAATPPAPKPKTPKPGKDGGNTTGDSGGTEAGGYGEKERDALDQLIGSATASPDAPKGEPSGH